MKNRFKTMSGAFALSFMLLFGALAFAGTANAGIANPNMGSTGVPSARAQGWDIFRHRRHDRRRYMRRRENREFRREMRDNR